MHVVRFDRRKGECQRAQLYDSYVSELAAGDRVSAASPLTTRWSKSGSCIRSMAFGSGCGDWASSRWRGGHLHVLMCALVVVCCLLLSLCLMS